MAMSARISKSFLRRCCKLQIRPFGKSHYRRGFSTSSVSCDESSIVNIPLSKSVSWIPSPKYAGLDNDRAETKVTTLENGLRVATENKFGQFSTVGVVLDSGSRYEVAYPSGITHFLEKLAFGTTDSYPNKDIILQQLEKVGGICDCQGSRDTLIYAMSANIEGLPEVMEILSEVILRPHITDQEIKDTQMATAFELEMLDMRPDAEPILMEMIHKAAYGDKTLGLPKYAPPQNILQINRSHIYTYMKNLHTPERMVLTGAGVEHDKMVELAQRYFVGRAPIWEEHPDLIDGSLGFDGSQAVYTGGMEMVEKDLSNVNPGPSPIPELAHIVIGLESCSHMDPDFIAYCVLNMLMGGGGSFSAGGPGKGMYTRLYLNVLNRYYWMYNATAYNHAYNDSGVFCIHASADPSALWELTEVITKELVRIPKGVGQEELSRAKTQLQSMLLMNLESRPVMFEDIGRQVLANNKRLHATHYYNEIDKITEADIIRVANRMLSSRPSVAALGSLHKLPSLKDIQSALQSRDGKLPRTFSSLLRR